MSDTSIPFFSWVFKQQCHYVIGEIPVSSTKSLSVHGEPWSFGGGIRSTSRTSSSASWRSSVSSWQMPQPSPWRWPRGPGRCTHFGDGLDTLGMAQLRSVKMILMLRVHHLGVHRGFFGLDERQQRFFTMKQGDFTRTDGKFHQITCWCQTQGIFGNDPSHH